MCLREKVLRFSKSSEVFSFYASILTCHRTRALQFHNAEHNHRGQGHKHVRKRRQDYSRRTDLTHRVGALLPMPSCLGIGRHTGESRQGHPRYTDARTVERPWVTSLGYQHGGGAGSLIPQIYEATTELCDKMEEMIVSDRIVDPLCVCFRDVKLLIRQSVRSSTVLITFVV